MKHISRILFSAIIIFSVFQAVAQKDIRLGLKVAPNIGWMNPDEKDYSFNGLAAGVSLGFVSDFYFSSNYGLSTGFTFSFLDGNLALPFAEKPDTGFVDRKYKFRYLEIPLMVKMRTKDYGKFSFYAQIGFGTGFRLKCVTKDEFTNQFNEITSEKRNITEDETTLIREAILVGIGTEIKLDESISLVVGLGYSNTLHNVLKGSNTRYPDRTNRSSLNYAELNIGVLF